MTPPTAIEGIVVGHHALGESDQWVRLLSRTQGRVSWLVPKGRASKRRFAGVFDLGNLVSIEGIPGRIRQRVQQAERVSGPRLARERVERIALLAYGCELCAALAPENAPAEKLFGLLRAWLDLLEEEGEVGDAHRLALEAKALTFAGFRPALLTCVHCGGALEGSVHFDVDGGGGSHTWCGDGSPVNASTLVGLEAHRRTPLASIQEMSFASPYTWLLSDFVQHQLGRALKSRAVLVALRADGFR